MKYLCDEDKWIVQETFKDRTCSKKRENERVFYPISEINLVQLAEMIGFTVKNIVSYKKINGDNNQWLFVLMK
jgi:hypothetical protein